MQAILNWFSANYGWIISLLIQSFIAYHVFFLSQRLSNRARLKHKETIQRKARELLSEIHRKKLNSEVYLVNINRFFKDYPSNKEKRFEGYSHIRAEIKSTRFDGIEFFAEMPVEVYQKRNGELSFKNNGRKKVFNAFPVGVVPYEWIEHIDINGDEYGGVPLVYCYFKGKTNWKFWKRLLFYGYPYKRMLFYKLSDVYKVGSDPPEMEYTPIDQPIKQ